MTGNPRGTGITDEPGSAAELRIGDVPAAQRYEARLGDVVVGFSEYRRVGNRVIFLHTEIDPAFEGRGFGGRLAAGALDDVRVRALTFTAKCPFISAYLKRHPEYEDLRAR
jgi:predicted GNAT family acetyltransferase